MKISLCVMITLSSPLQSPKKYFKFPFPLCLAEVKDLIRRCLALRPSDRPTLEEIMMHSWIRNPEMDKVVRPVENKLKSSSAISASDLATAMSSQESI